MAKPGQSTWPKIWDDATRKYLAERELVEKAHEHWYNKNKIKKETQETPPEMRDLNAFMAELENQRKKFNVVTSGSSLILDSMAAIAAPLDLLMSQAGAIAGAVRWDQYLTISHSG
jgi:glucan-binding YG repeat protein